MLGDQNETPKLDLSKIDFSGVAGGQEFLASQAAQEVSGDAGDAPFTPGADAAPDYSQFTQPTEPAGDQATPGAPAAGTSQDAAAPDGTPGATTDQEPEPKQDYWKDFYAAIPEPLHQDIKPFLEEADRRVERIIDAVEPLRPILESGKTVDDIQLALEMQQQLFENPKAFYDYMGQNYGWTQDTDALRAENDQLRAALVAQAQGAPAPTGGQFDDIFGAGQADPTAGLPPQLQAQLGAIQQQLAAQQQFTQAQMQAQQQAAQQAQMQAAQQAQQAQLVSELNGLESKYGQFDRDEVVRRAIANMQTGGNPSLSNAFHELRDYENRVAQRYRANKPAAPQVVGQGGGAGTPPPAAAPKLDTEDARRAAALALAVQLGANPNGVQ